MYFFGTLERIPKQIQNSSSMRNYKKYAITEKGLSKVGKAQMCKQSWAEMCVWFIHLFAKVSLLQYFIYR